MKEENRKEEAAKEEQSGAEFGEIGFGKGTGFGSGFGNDFEGFGSDNGFGKGGSDFADGFGADFGKEFEINFGKEDGFGKEDFSGPDKKSGFKEEQTQSGNGTEVSSFSGVAEERKTVVNGAREKSEPAGDKTKSRDGSISGFAAEESGFSESDILQAFGKLKETTEPERGPEETGETVKVKEEIKKAAETGVEPAPGTEPAEEIREAEQEPAESEDGAQRAWYEPEGTENGTPMNDAEKIIEQIASKIVADGWEWKEKTPDYGKSQAPEKKETRGQGSDEIKEHAKHSMIEEHALHEHTPLTPERINALKSEDGRFYLPSPPPKQKSEKIADPRKYIGGQFARINRQKKNKTGIVLAALFGIAVFFGSLLFMMNGGGGDSMIFMAGGVLIAVAAIKQFLVVLVSPQANAEKFFLVTPFALEKLFASEREGTIAGMRKTALQVYYSANGEDRIAKTEFCYTEEQLNRLLAAYYRGELVVACRREPAGWDEAVVLEPL